MGRTAVALACFALRWGVVGGVIRSVVPWPSEMRIAERIEHLRDHPDAYDTLFFGSSHFYRSFVPAVIDTELANLGHSIRSFNMGAPGMSVFEMDFLIRRVLEQSESRYRWIAFEYSFYPFQNLDQITSQLNYFNDRVVFWHTPGRTRGVVRTAAASTLGFDHKFAVSWAHTLHGLWRFGSVGQDERIVASMLDQPQIREDYYRRTRGYESLEKAAGTTGRQERELFLETPGPFREMVATIDGLNRMKVEIDALELRPLRSLQKAIRASGARPIVAIPAIPNASPTLISLASSGEVETLIAMNSPARFPSPYRVDRRFDGLHLNELGAREYSREFAYLFSEVLDDVSERVRNGGGE